MKDEKPKDSSHSLRMTKAAPCHPERSEGSFPFLFENRMTKTTACHPERSEGSFPSLFENRMTKAAACHPERSEGSFPPLFETGMTKAAPCHPERSEGSFPFLFENGIKSKGKPDCRVSLAPVIIPTLRRACGNAMTLSGCASLCHSAAHPQGCDVAIRFPCLLFAAISNDTVCIPVFVLRRALRPGAMSRRSIPHRILIP